MGEVSRALKKCFIAWNIIVALAGAAVCTFTVIIHVKRGTAEEVNYPIQPRTLLYEVSAVSIAITVLGIYGSYKDKKWALVVFLTLLTLGCIVVLMPAIQIVGYHNEIESSSTDIIRLHLPLNHAGEELKNYIGQLQSTFQCCGFFDGYRDWNNEIPESCFCPQSYNPDDCEAIKTDDIKIFSPLKTPHPDAEKLVYKERCLSFFNRYIKTSMHVTLAILFGLFVLGVLGISLCSAILHQKRIPQGHEGPVVFSAISKELKYRELKSNVGN